VEQAFQPAHLHQRVRHERAQRKNYFALNHFAEKIRVFRYASWWPFF
jgi:hypothetical protein